jgi:multiple sugar transport system ATP-binding protein
MASVVLAHVSKQFDGVVAVDDLSLEVDDEELLVVLGPSGCGKSTALRMIAGLEAPTDGTITIGDRVVNNVEAKDRDISMVFQNYALYPHMTVRRNIEFPLRSRKVPSTERDRLVADAAESLGLTEYLDRKPAQLSGGQRQRVALARAIVRRPAVFLMDEPLSNLDAKLRVQTRAELVELQRRLAATVVYVTHDQVEAMTMGHRIAVMTEGVLQQVGTPQEVYRRPANVFVATFLGAPPMNLIAGALESTPAGWRFRGQNIDVPLSAEVISPPELEHEIELRGDIRFGLRPEHFRICAPGEDGGIAGEVRFLEPVGSDLYLTVAVGGTSVQVRTDPDSTLQPGDNLSLLFDPWRVHIFGADGHNLRRDAAPVASPAALASTSP